MTNMDHQHRIYAIDGPSDISARDFVRLYGPKLETILENPNAKILITDLSGVGIYTARYLISHHYRNAVLYHVGSKPRQNIANLDRVGGFKTQSEVRASMILDADEVFDISHRGQNLG